MDQRSDNAAVTVQAGVNDRDGREKRTVDDAWKYLQSHAGEGQADVDSSKLKIIRRKVDWHIIPLMFLCYTMQFIDKVLLNYAGVMGIRDDIKLVGNDFTNAASSFFIAYLVAEIPNAYLLQRVPPAKWLGMNVFTWGIVTATTAAVKDYPTLLVARIFLGIFEATIGPSLMLISSQWYTKSEQAPRFCLWYLGLGTGQILGGIVSFGFQHATGGGLAGWRIMFIVLGVVTMIIGVATGLFVPDTPMQAKFSATLIRNMGFTSKESALLNMPSGGVSIFFTLLVGFGIRKASNRWAWIAMCSVPGIVGGALMSFLPNRAKPGLLIGVYLVNAIVAPLAIIYQWTAANCAGSTKRAFASALVAGSFSVGNIIGPQTFQDRDAPEYRPAKIAVLATQAAAAVMSVVLFGYYKWENRRRDTQYDGADSTPAPERERQAAHPEAWAGLTDKENTKFRYVY